MKLEARSQKQPKGLQNPKKLEESPRRTEPSSLLLSPIPPCLSFRQGALTRTNEERVPYQWAWDWCYIPMRKDREKLSDLVRVTEWLRVRARNGT